MRKKERKGKIVETKIKKKTASAATKFLVSVMNHKGRSKLYWVRVENENNYSDEKKYDKAHELAKKLFVKNHSDTDKNKLYSIIVKAIEVSR